jgi:hypothetical protein
MPNCVNNQNLVLVIFHVKFLFFVGFFCCKILIVVAQLHMVSLLSTKFHEILFISFRGVVPTNCDGQDKNNLSPHKSGGRHNSSETTEQNFMKLV